MQELIVVLDERCLDVLYITETKCNGSEITDLPGGTMALGSEVPQSDRATAVAGIILSSSLVPGVKYFGMVDSRLFWVHINLGIARVFTFAPVSSLTTGDLKKF